MGGTITKDDLEQVEAEYGPEVAQHLLESDCPTFLDFLIAEDML